MDPLGAGTDHVSHLVDGLVVRVAREPDPARLEREARLLQVVAEISPLPVPRPVLVVPEEGRLAYPLLPGVPLLDVPVDRRAALAGAVGEALGRLLRRLHDVPEDRVADLAGRDDFPPAAWLDEVAAHRDVVPGEHGRAVDAFLAAAPPAPAARLVFSHNDLGIEHVLVDAGRITGIIDWSDAALADPARDFGLVLRDLGPAALDAARPPADLRDRAWFHARCALLEDLAYGLESGDARYVDKSLAALPWLF